MAAEVDPLETALRALRHRERSVAELEARLEQRGIEATERRDALETLERIGYVDDERLARSRADELARRGAGDELIRHDLEGRGIDPTLIDAALGALEPERERADAVVAKRGRSSKTARYLAARGFAAEVVEALVAPEE